MIIMRLNCTSPTAPFQQAAIPYHLQLRGPWVLQSPVVKRIYTAARLELTQTVSTNLPPLKRTFKHQASPQLGLPVYLPFLGSLK